MIENVITTSSESVAAEYAVIAKWIIPVVPENVVYENHCIVVKANRILDIVKVADLEMKYNVSHVIDLREDGFDHIIAPGMFNMHTHSGMSLLRGYADDVSLHDWLNNFIWPAEAQFVSEEFVKVSTELAAVEMLKTGTTYCNDMYWFPEVTAKVFEQVGMRATVAITIIKFPTAYAKTESEYIEKGIKLIDDYKGSDTIKISFGPHAVYTITDETYLRVKELAKQHDLVIHTHLHETHKEVEDEVKESGKRPIERMNDLGLLSNKLVAAHMTQLRPNEVKLVAEKKVNVVHCPESNLKLGVAGISPIHQLISQNVNVSIGTDSTASNDDLDMLGEMRTAAYVDKLCFNFDAINHHVSKEKIENIAGTVTPAQKILTMGTINGAKALGVDNNLGSIEKGKFADFISVKVTSPPVYDPISHLIYCGTNQVTNVWVGGKQVVKNSKITTIDEEDLKKRVHEFSLKIAQARPKTKTTIIQ
eukprot:gene7879-9698_t